MKQVYYIAGAVILAVITLGIFSSWAQDADNGADGVLIIEEQDTAVLPVQNNSANAMPSAVPAGQNSGVQNSTNSGFQPLPGDPGVEVEPAPAVQPDADKTKSDMSNKNDNTDTSDGAVWIEEDVVETSSGQ